MDTFQAEKGCAMNLLSVLFGRQISEHCGACPFCRTSIPLRTLQLTAKKRIEVVGKDECATQQVLSKLVLSYLVCNKPGCQGLPLLKGKGCKHLPENRDVCFNWSMCYACGVDSRDREDCPLNKSCLHKKACCECWVFKHVPGYVRHETTDCPVTGRLRRLLSHKYLEGKENGRTFQSFVEQIYTSEASFCQFLSAQETPLEKIQHR